MGSTGSFGIVSSNVLIGNATVPGHALVSTADGTVLVQRADGAAERLEVAGNVHANVFALPGGLTVGSGGTANQEFVVALAGAPLLRANVAGVTAPSYFGNGASLTSLVLGPGTAAAPTFAFATDRGSGLYAPSTGVVGIAAAGQERARVDSSALSVGGGNVRLFANGNVQCTGTISASYLVGNGVNLTGTGTTNASLLTSGTLDTARLPTPVRLGSGSAAAPAFAFTASTNTGVYSASTGTVSVAAGGVETLRVSGGVVSVPGGLVSAEKVQVTSSGSAIAPALIFGAAADTGVYSASTGTVSVASGGVEVVRASAAAFNVSGALSIGPPSTTTLQLRRDTSNRLNVNDDIISTNTVFAQRHRAPLLDGDTATLSGTGQTTALLDVTGSTATHVAEFTGVSNGAGTHVVRIAGTPGAGGRHLSVVGDTTLNGGTLLTATGLEGSTLTCTAANANAQGIVNFVGTNGRADGHVVRIVGNPGTGGNNLFVQGTAAKTGGGSWATASDRRLKEDIQLADTALCHANFSRLPLQRFKWQDAYADAVNLQDRHMLGWIAQDVEAVFPKSVGATYVSSAPGVEMKSVDETQMLRTLWGAVQHLAAKVESLEAAIQK